VRSFRRADGWQEKQLKVLGLAADGRDRMPGLDDLV
jgi:hypothetical protein